MQVIVNGEPREIASSRVDALLAELDYEGTHFAIALNYDVVPKSRWAETALKPGEIVTAVVVVPRVVPQSELICLNVNGLCGHGPLLQPGRFGPPVTEISAVGKRRMP